MLNCVNYENIQAKLLRNLLFFEWWIAKNCSVNCQLFYCPESKQVYGGKTLFEQFDPDIQRQIEPLCVEIKSILRKVLTSRTSIWSRERVFDLSYPRLFIWLTALSYRF